MNDLTTRLREKALILDSEGWGGSGGLMREAANVIDRLRAAESAIQPCGHAAKWLAYRNPVDVQSERYCVFCEVERLEEAARR